MGLEPGKATGRHCAAKAKGTVYKGRKPALTAERIKKLREQAATAANKSKRAKEFGISRETLYQYIREQRMDKESIAGEIIVPDFPRYAYFLLANIANTETIRQL